MSYKKTVDNQGNNEKIRNLQNSLTSTKKGLIIFGSISFFLFAFVVTAMILIASWGENLDSLVGPVFLILLGEIPLTLIFVALLKSYNKTKKELFLLSKENDTIHQILNNEQKKSIKTIFIIIGVIAVVILLIIVSITGGDSSYNDHTNNKNDKDGFIGSDGEYHEYVPEFGDDVNNWMEENW